MTGPFLVFLAAMLWATDAPFRLFLTKELSSTFIVLGEHLVDVAIILPVLFAEWRSLAALKAKEWAAVLFVGIAGSALGSIAFTQAFHYVNPSVAILLQKLQPLIAIALSAVLLREALHPRFFAYAALALGGAYLISFPNLVPQLYPGEAFNPNVLGVSLALFAALVWGASTVLGKVVLHRVSFRAVTALRFSIALAFLLAYASYSHAFPVPGTLTLLDIGVIGVIALASGVISLLIYYRGLAQTNASVATLAELGFPLAAVVVNWLFIPGSALVPVQLLGMGILLVSIWRLAAYNREVAVVVA
jgi:drug/metabolite transporter (DMT)-like permease